MLDGERADGATRLRSWTLRELEWNDARNGSKNLNAAPPRRRPHARIDRRALCSLTRALDVRQLIEARALAAQPPGWAAIFVKAFALVAKDEPVLRTLYAKWPWPSFYELPRSIAMVAIARVEDGQDCVLPQKVPAADTLTLTEVDAQIRQAKDAPIGEVPAFRKILRVTRLPLPLRRLMWLVGLNFGRQRANWFGSFGVTSVAAYGAGELHALSPGPFILSYGVRGAGPDHRRGDPLGSPDYRRRPDRQGPDPAGTGAECRDRGRIAWPKAAGGAKAGPGDRDLTAEKAVIPGRRASAEPGNPGVSGSMLRIPRNEGSKAPGTEALLIDIPVVSP